MNDPEFIKEQLAALKALERAFKKCSDAGLLFMGMDRNLLVWDEQQLEEKREEYGDRALYESHLPMRAAGYKIVKTHGSYEDSGGW